jgi:biotin operon repressor
MPSHAVAIRRLLATQPQSGSQMAKALGLSQPTVSRALASMRDEVVQIGEKKTSRYLLRDTQRGFGDIDVYRVDVRGKIIALGRLTPTRPDGFVFTQTDGLQTHHDGLPWWLIDMRPQGFLGRAYVGRYGAQLGLPHTLHEWSDTHALRALLLHGHDSVGNLLLGEHARDIFLSAPTPVPLKLVDKIAQYERLSVEASQGGQPGSSAGGEQPKFTAYVQTKESAHHVIVKFSQPQQHAVSQRWRDLLLAEHLALDTLRHAGMAAAQSTLIDTPQQRFLEVQRFDRVGALGRKALISLAAFDAEFVGMAQHTWPVITQALAQQGVITQQAAQDAQRLWAFGALIGNTDMHHGNLSFISEQGRPYDLAPAYDMTPMAFAPNSSGFLPQRIPAMTLASSVTPAHWREAEMLARDFLHRIHHCDEFSQAFDPCIQAIENHLAHCSTQIERLGA